LPDTRLNKCPKWTSNVETRPKSGSMDVLSISEKTQVGDKVYLLLAMDPEQEPLYYFIRKAEAEVQETPNESVDETIFRVNVVKMGLSWVGEVSMKIINIFIFKIILEVYVFNYIVPLGL
jgi:hypothetical protein